MTSRTSSEECAAKDHEEPHTKWTPFDVVELKENSAAVTGSTPANEAPRYSEKKDGEFIRERNLEMHD